MTALTASRPQLHGLAVPAQIVVAGLAGAAIDAAYFSSAALLRGKSPVGVLQSIAGFWFGSQTFSLGAGSALAGAITHVALATIMGAGFWFLAKRLEILRDQPVAGGLAYGLLLYATMYYLVMPLRWPTVYPRWDGWSSVLDISVHLVIGIAFAFLYRGFSKSRASSVAD